MIFKKLVLKNFKSHVNTEVEFHKGTTIILGDNGAGKSSIFEGINFALYKKYNTKSLNDLINTKANSMSVELSFLAGGKEYQVRRTRSQKKSTAELFVLKDDNYDSIVSGDKEVNNYIEELLEIDADLFLNAIYIKQGEIDSLVTQKASERKKNISKLLRLENLEISYKNIANVISNYELKRNQINSLIDDNFQDNKKELVKECKILQNNFDAQNIKLESLQQEIKKNKEKIDNEIVKNTKFNQLHRKQQQLITESELLADEFKSMEQQIADIDKYQDIVQENEEAIKYKDDYKELIEIMEEHRKHVADEEYKSIMLTEMLHRYYDINNICKVYKREPIIFEDDYDKDGIKQLSNIVNQDYDETQKALNLAWEQDKELSVKIKTLEATISHTQKSIDTLQEVGSVCPVCQSPIDDNHKKALIKEYQVILEDDKAKLDKLNEESSLLYQETRKLERMRLDKEEYRSFILGIQRSEDSIENAQQRVYEARDIAKASLNQVNTLKKQLNLQDASNYDIHKTYNDLLEKSIEYHEAKQILDNMTTIKDKCEKIKMDYHNKITDLEEVDNKIMFLNFDSEVLQQYQQQQSDLQGKYYPLVKEIGRLENDIKYHKTQIQNIDEKIKQNKENKEKVAKLDDFIKFLKDIREIYSKDGLQKDIRLSFKPQIENYTQSFFNKFDFDYSELKLTEDYDIVITGPSGDSDITMVSGGEKIAIALSLRLGIAQAITANTVETILLDEPTTYLDAMRKQEFVNIIHNISLTPQMIVITHDPELESAANNIIVVKKKNGQSIIE